MPRTGRQHTINLVWGQPNFQDAHLGRIGKELIEETEQAQEARKRYREKRALWQAFEEADPSRLPYLGVLLKNRQDLLERE